MHLVRKKTGKTDEGEWRGKVGGVAGLLIEWAQTLWLGARMRRAVKKQMCLLETLCLGGKKQLMLVSCGGERYLVGTGADSVQTIVRVRAEMMAPSTGNVAQGLCGAGEPL